MSVDSTISSNQLPIAVDAMGGDHGPRVVVEGTVEAARSHGIHSILVGDSNSINSELDKLPGSRDLPISIVHASDVVGMEESPARAVRNKPDSSIRVAFELVTSGRASAVVSQGNTGAIMAAGILVSGTLPGVARPAIASLIPKALGGTPTVLLDAGANTGCQAEQLVQFAMMGRQYAITGLGCPNPRVALLSNGKEISKGNDLIRSTALMLSEIPGIQFIGYVEGRDVARDVVDVVVCDGFVGNILLKGMEGTIELVFDSLKQLVEKSWRAKIGLWIAKPAIKSVFKEKLDPSAHGGAPLLGLHHVAIKCHGSATSRAIMNGIRVANRFVKEDLIGSMTSTIGGLDLRFDGDGEDGVWMRVGQKFEKGSRIKRRLGKAAVGAAVISEVGTPSGENGSE